ncbi:MAG: peptide MFS transporter [Dysgonamonadaceae bacterium]|jgi:POT family proton-dependent oligopeptide transporter|nr:peptide MFS transporter [Dysgonamonadaceae bacterium]
MFKNHPKGLYALALANTGERFGYYTMLAIFVLFLQAKFGLSSKETSDIFGGFLAIVYFMPLFGGIIADKWWGYGKTVTIGIIVMFAGYLFLSIPTARDSFSMGIMFAALFLIALGTGLFKGNLQVMVGNLYDNPKYSTQRDSAFSIFYMAINLGALYAPTAATKVTNYFLGKAGLSYNAKIPNLAHQYLDGAIQPQGLTELTDLAAAQTGTTDLTAFSNLYIDRLSEAYNYGFAVACFSLIVSMLIYVVFRKTYKHADYSSKQLATAQKADDTKKLSPQQTKERIIALVLVFSVIIFFWMSFHQNGLTMTWFARDYTANLAQGLDRIGFDVLNLTFILVAVYALFNIFQSATAKSKLIAGGISGAAIVGLIINYMNMAENVEIVPQIFQQFNPFFVVVLTPISLAIFGALAKKGKEPSAPRKIGIGMLIAALGFAILAFGSMGLATPDALEAVGGVSSELVSPNWLISTYLVLTFAELLLSPMGISFVSKVAPPQYKGLMMGGWFAATAIGNYMVSIIGRVWGGIQLWLVWGILIGLCLLSALFMFSILKKLERVTKDC